MTTQKFTLTVGRAPGYGHDNDPDLLVTAKEVCALWQDLMVAEGAATGVFAPAVVQNGLAAYQTEHGCPRGGEEVLVLSGVMYPDSMIPPRRWAAGVTRVADALRKKLGQVTATLEFHQAEVFRLTSITDPRPGVCSEETAVDDGLNPVSITKAAYLDVSAYGYCPKCGAPGRTRERRPNGNDTCERGCTYPSKDAVDEPRS